MSSADGQPGQRSISTPRIVIAGATEDCGASSLVLGLLVVLRQRGLSVASARLGSSVLETAYHRRVTGRFSFLLDPEMLSLEQLQHGFARLTTGADLVVLGAEHPVLDERGERASVSTEAQVAELLGSPVVVVADARFVSEGIVAFVRGIAEQCPGLRGVIVNRVRDEAQAARIRKAFARVDNFKLLGLIEENSQAAFLAMRQTQCPTVLSREYMLLSAEILARQIDIEGLLQISETSEPLTVADPVVAGSPRTCRIALADDQAFCVTIQDNLDLLRRAGAEIVTFSPLADAQLPPHSNALYLPSGYPELYAEALSENERLRRSILDFSLAGKPIYAEGSALAYLARTMTTADASTHVLIGALPAHVSLRPSRDEAGSGAELFELAQATWTKPSVVAAHDAQCLGLVERKWLIRLESNVELAMRIEDRYGMRAPVEEGLQPSDHLLCSQFLGHWGSCPANARRFLARASAGNQ